MAEVVAMTEVVVVREMLTTWSGGCRVGTLMPVEQ